MVEGEQKGGWRKTTQFSNMTIFLLSPASGLAPLLYPPSIPLLPPLKKQNKKAFRLACPQKHTFPRLPSISLASLDDSRIPGADTADPPPNGLPHEVVVPPAGPPSAGLGSSVLSFLCPLLKLLGSGDPSAPRNALLETTTSGLATLARLPWGSKVLPDVATSAEDRKTPLEALQLYEFEACPFCRRVREALTELDLSVEVYPCPKGSLRHRQVVRQTGGKDQFPFLVDPNMSMSMYESGDIVMYLFNTYGGSRKPSAGLLESTLFTGWVPTIMRAGRGMTLWQQVIPEPPEKKLELFSYENNMFARIVREALCELELPYVLHNVGAGSKTITTLQQLAGSTEVPYLVDPNTGMSLGNHEEILSYLFKTYSNSKS